MTFHPGLIEFMVVGGYGLGVSILLAAWVERIDEKLMKRQAARPAQRVKDDHGHDAVIVGSTI